MTEFLEVYLPACVNILLIVLLIVGIVLGVRLINTLNRINEVIDNVEAKVNSLNGLFNVINFTTDKITAIGDRVVEGVNGLIKRFSKKRYSSEMEDDDYE